MAETDLLVIGGGQLARMMAPAALQLGIRLRLLAESADSSAAQVIVDQEVGDYNDLATLRRLAEGAPVITFDHEHVPTEHLNTLQDEGHVCRPGPHALVYAQDKLKMRARLTNLKVPCPEWSLVHDENELAQFAEANGGFPVVLKSPRGGYDGKGVWFVDSAKLPVPGPLLAEARVDFVRELAVLVARNPSGDVVTYPVVESVQENGICREVIAPAPNLDADRMARAQRIGVLIANKLDVTGILAVEMFETKSGEFLVNELAMRPHNTGHWTIDGATTSQFENHIRAVLDLPLGDPSPIAPVSVMVNVLGGDNPDVVARSALETDPRVKVHLYGKEVKPGRKIGHITVTGEDLAGTLEVARAAARRMEGGSAR